MDSFFQDIFDTEEMHIDDQMTDSLTFGGTSAETGREQQHQCAPEKQPTIEETDLFWGW